MTMSISGSVTLLEKAGSECGVLTGVHMPVCEEQRLVLVGSYIHVLIQSELMYCFLPEQRAERF